MRVIDKLKLGIIIFWALWFSLATFTNIVNFLNQFGWLAPNWRVMSHNFALIQGVVSIYSLPQYIVTAMFITIIIWECVISSIFWLAAWQFFLSDCKKINNVNLAFTLSIFLWAGFLVAEEFFIAYQFEQLHLILLVSQLICLMAIQLLED